MIQVTDEMVVAYRDARAALNQEQMHGRPPTPEDDKIRTGLAAVLALVDYPDFAAVAKRAYEQGQADERALTAMGF